LLIVCVCVWGGGWAASARVVLRWFERHIAAGEVGQLSELDEYRTWWPTLLLAPAEEDAERAACLKDGYGDCKQVWLPVDRILCRFIPCFHTRGRSPAKRVFSTCLLPLSITF